MSVYSLLSRSAELWSVLNELKSHMNSLDAQRRRQDAWLKQRFHYTHIKQ